MTCKDCLHCESCKGTYDILDTTFSGEFDYEKFARSCKNFTDRAEWVHLPCKVGDRIWYIRNGSVSFRFISKSSIYSIATSGKLGKTAFLTREEAEKALEGNK